MKNFKKKKMKKFLVRESERLEILKRHKLLVEQGVKAPTDLELLRAGRDAGCFGKRDDQYWGILTLPSGQVVFQKTAKAKGREGFLVRILPNQTYYYYNPTTKKSTGVFDLPTKCDAMTNFGQAPKQDPRIEADIAYYKKLTPPYKTVEELIVANEYTPDINNPALWDNVKVGNTELFRKKGTQSGAITDPNNQIRQQWVKWLEEKGYKVDPADTEKAGLTPVRLYDAKIEGLPQGIFPQDQVVYFDQAANRDETNLKSKQEDEDVKRKECKDRIRAFYQEFLNTKGRQITDRAALQIRKDEAQFCKNRYDGKWGIGGGKFDDMIAVLSGQRRGGPSSSGEDSIFRLQ